MRETCGASWMPPGRVNGSGRNRSGSLPRFAHRRQVRDRRRILVQTLCRDSRESSMGMAVTTGSNALSFDSVRFPAIRRESTSTPRPRFRSGAYVVDIPAAEDDVVHALLTARRRGSAGRRRLRRRPPVVSAIWRWPARRERRRLPWSRDAALPVAAARPSCRATRSTARGTSPSYGRGARPPHPPPSRTPP